MTGKPPPTTESRSALSRVVSGVPEPEPSDRELLALLRAREPRGFDLTYARYAERVFGFLVRLTRSRAVAEDLFQHTFLRLAERGPQLREDSELRAWLFSVARNAFHDHMRAQALSARFEPQDFAAEASCGPETSLILNELELGLSRLATEDRELLLLVGVEGLSPLAVSKMLAIDPVALRKRLSRARARLAEVLDTRGEVVRNSEQGR